MSNKAECPVYSVAFKTLFSQFRHKYQQKSFRKSPTLDVLKGLFLVGVFHVEERLVGKKATTLVLLDKALNTQGRSVKKGQEKLGVADKQWLENNN